MLPEKEILLPKIKFILHVKPSYVMMHTAVFQLYQLSGNGIKDMIDKSFTSSYHIAHERKRRRSESLLVTASNMRHKDMRFFNDLP